MENPATPSGIAHLLLSFEGRVSRRWFWLGMAIATMAFFAFASIAAGLFRGRDGGMAEILLMAAALVVGGYLSAALIVKRLRDRGRSPWLYPVYGIAPFVLYYLALLLQGSATATPGLLAVASNTAALAIWLVALIDLGILRGVE
jgi:uncharacterized membrane protein YhaH (DUF805 family)